jgi:hypothetical protein
VDAWGTLLLERKEDDDLPCYHLIAKYSTGVLGHASIQSSERYAKLSNQRVKQVYQQAMRQVMAKTRV